MNKSEYIIVVLFLLLVCFLDIKIFHLSQFDNDQADWALYAKQSLENKKFPIQGLMGSLDIYQGLLAVYVYMGIFSLFGCSMQAIEAGVIIIHILSVYVLYIVSKKIYNKPIALLACTFYIISPTFISSYSLEGNDYCFYFIPLTLAIYSIHRVINDNNPKYYLLLALSISAAIQFHSSAYLILPAYLVYLLLNFNNAFSLSKKSFFYFLLSCLILVCLNSYHLYTIYKAWPSIAYRITRNGPTFGLIGEIVKQFSAMAGFVFSNCIKLKSKIFYFLDLNVILIILFCFFLSFKPLNSRFFKNDYLLATWIIVTMIVFMICSHYFNHTPSPIFLVFFPAVFLALGSCIYKLYFYLKDRMIIKVSFAMLVILIITFNIASSVFAINFISSTGGIGWYRPTRGIKIAVVEYIFSIDGDPTIVLIGDKKDAWWRYSPYRFIIETRKGRSGPAKGYCFYVVEKKSMWYKPIFNRLSDLDAIIEEKEIGPVKIICSEEHKINKGMVLRQSFLR